MENYKLYREFINRPELDWAVVFLFYTLLHLLTAYAYEKSDPYKQFSTHRDRDDFILLNPEVSEISKDYNTLFQRTNTARYHPDRPHLTVDEIKQLEREEFTNVVDHLRTLYEFSLT